MSSPLLNARCAALGLPALLLLCALVALPVALATAQSHAAADQQGNSNVAATDRQQEKQAPPVRSRLRGRAVYDDTGRPVRRARVRLLADNDEEDGTAPETLANARGEFEFKNLAAGRYVIFVEGPGLLTPYSFLNIEDQQASNINFNAFRERFESVTVDGRTDAEVQVRARRGGAITGRVTYENGDPAINVTVTLMRRQDGKLRQYMGGVGNGPEGSTPTDDRGVYRFAGLPPGDYLVSVNEQIEHGEAPSGEYEEGPASDSTPLVATYHPAAAHPKDATAIRVGGGEEHAGTDITLLERGLYTLGGIVRAKRGGRPLANARLSLHLKEWEAEEMPLVIDHSVTSDEQGRWQFKEVPDGLYVLTVQPQAETDPIAVEAYNVAMSAAVESGDEAAMQRLRQPAPVQHYAGRQQEIKIDGQDQPGLIVELSAGGSISGTVVVEGGKEPSGYLALYPEVSADGRRAIYGSQGVVQNGSFVLGGIQPGKAYLVANAGGSEGRYYVKSITAGGVTYTNNPLVIEDGTTLRGVHVVLTTEVGTLKGRVRRPGKENASAPGATVLLVPADAQRWPWFHMQSYTRTNLDGTFELNVRPGDYLAFVLPAHERARLLFADEIGRFSAGAQRVTLRAGKTEQLELTQPDDK
jgi:hypothetical protein